MTDDRQNTVTVDSWFGPVRVETGEDNPIQCRVPAGKVRGRRRYYRRLTADIEKVVVSSEGWYCHRHWHVDWRGIGNLSWRDRRSHLTALFETYRRVLDQTKDWSKPYQCWLQIDAVDSSQDAVFLHTPNPNADNFPLNFDRVTWGVQVPDLLTEFLTDSKWQFGVSDTWRGDLRTHFIVRRADPPL